MTVQHADIPEAELHESKGASTATAGAIAVADGVGSAVWGHTINTVHGEIYHEAASVSVGPTGGTITNDAHYIVVDGTWSVGSDMSNMGLYSNSRAIEVDISGHYLLSSFITFTTGAVAAGTKYALKYRVNNSATLSTRRLVTEKVTAGVDSLCMSGTALVTLTAGDYIELMMASSTADTITVTDTGLTLVLLNTI